MGKIRKLMVFGALTIMLMLTVVITGDKLSFADEMTDEEVASDTDAEPATEKEGEKQGLAFFVEQITAQGTSYSTSMNTSSCDSYVGKIPSPDRYYSWCVNWTIPLANGSFKSICDDIWHSKRTMACNTFVNEALTRLLGHNVSMTSATANDVLHGENFHCFFGTSDSQGNHPAPRLIAEIDGSGNLEYVNNDVVGNYRNGDILVYYKKVNNVLIPAHMAIAAIQEDGTIAQYQASQLTSTTNDYVRLETLGYYLSGARNNAVSYGLYVEIYRRYGYGKISIKKQINGQAPENARVSAEGIRFDVYKAVNNSNTMLSYNDKIASFVSDAKGSCTVSEVNTQYVSAENIGRDVLSGLPGGRYVVFEDTGNSAILSEGKEFKTISVEEGNNNTFATSFYLYSKHDGASKTMGYGGEYPYYYNYKGNPQYYCTLSIEVAEGVYKEITVDNSYDNEYSLKLIKESSEKNISDGLDTYSLVDAGYAVYSDEESARVAQENNYASLSGYVGLLTTGQDGTSNVITGLRKQKYYVKEVMTPKGYIKSENIYTADLGDESLLQDDTYILYVEDVPEYYRLDILIDKKDAVDNTPIEGAEFTIEYFDMPYEAVENNMIEAAPRRVWHVKTDSDGIVIADDAHKIGGDEWFKNSMGEIVFPEGIITVHETKAPEGYIADSNEYIRKLGLNAETGAFEFETINIHEVPDMQCIEIIKTGENPQGECTALSNVGFSACNVKDLELGAEGKYIWDDEKRIEFGPDGSLELFTDEEGYAKSAMLRYGTYMIRETTIPEHYISVDDFFVTISKEDTPVHKIELVNRHISGRLKLHKLGVEYEETEDKEWQRVEMPLADIQFGVYAAEDIMTYDGNSVFYAAGALVEEIKTDTEGNAMTTKPLPEGRYRVSESVTSEEYVASEDIYFDMEYPDDIDDCTVKDTEYISEYELCVSNYKKPEIKTQAWNEATGEKEAVAGEKITIADNIFYKNLITGRRYDVYGTVMDKASGQPIVVDGKELIVSDSFIAVNGVGTYKLAFPEINTSDLGGKELVVFEKIYIAGTDELIASHEDIEDVGQTIYIKEFPEEETEATTTEETSTEKLTTEELTTEETTTTEVTTEAATTEWKEEVKGVSITSPKTGNDKYIVVIVDIMLISLVLTLVVLMLKMHNETKQN